LAEFGRTCTARLYSANLISGVWGRDIGTE
jgi:hypothetical protein